MRYFVYGYYGEGNLGDELMLQALLSGIELHDSDARFIVRSHTPSAIPRHLSDKVTWWTRDKRLQPGRPKWIRFFDYVKALWKVVGQVDSVIIGGGTLFIDKGQFNPSLLFIWFLAIFAKWRRRRFIVTGVAIDILTHPTSLWLTKKIMTLAEFVAVRDEFSLRYLDKVPSQRKKLATDLTFLLPLPEPNSHRRTRPRVAFTFIDYFRTLEISDASHMRYKQQIIDIAQALSRDCNIACVALQEGRGQRDDWMREALSESVEAEYRLLREEGDLSWFADEVDIVITSRFHLALIAARMGKRILLIDHELKMTAVARQFHLLAVSMTEFLTYDPKQLCEQILNCTKPVAQIDLDRSVKLAANNFAWMGI